MMKNERCPLQTECEKKCTFMGHELDCPYYNANAREDLTIPDQEERRERMWRQQEEAEIAVMGDEDDEDAEEPGEALTAAEGQEVAARPIEVITAEIWLYKQQAGAAILEIGRRLNEAKAQLTHGEWLPWLEEKVEFSEATAQRFMRLAREYENPSLVTDLGASKALQLLALPPFEREEFIAEKHEVNGQEKTVLEMSKRELAQAIKERDEARRKAEDLEQAMEAQLEEQRTVYDVDMAEIQGKLEEAENRAAVFARKLEDAKARAAADLEEAQGEVEALKAQLEELEDAPKPVAVETIVDEEAVKAAAEEARREATEALKAKIEKAEKARDKAEQAKAKAEQDLAAMKVAQEEAQAITTREKQTLAEQVQTLQKKLAVASSSEMTIFKLHFEQGQASINKMTECITKMAEAGDGEGAGKLRKALAALLATTLEVLKDA